MQIQAVYTRNLGVKFMWQRNKASGSESNQALRVVLERAKTYNVPRTIIDRAVEKQKAVQKKIMTSFVMKDSHQMELWLL